MLKIQTEGDNGKILPEFSGRFQLGIVDDGNGKFVVMLSPKRKWASEFIHWVILAAIWNRVELRTIENCSNFTTYYIFSELKCTHLLKYLLFCHGKVAGEKADQLRRN